MRYPMVFCVPMHRRDVYDSTSRITHMKNTLHTHSVFKWTQPARRIMFTECLVIGLYSTTLMTSLYIQRYLHARFFAMSCDSDRIKKIE